MDSFILKLEDPPPYYSKFPLHSPTIVKSSLEFTYPIKICPLHIFWSNIHRNSHKYLLLDAYFYLFMLSYWWFSSHRNFCSNKSRIRAYNAMLNLYVLKYSFHVFICIKCNLSNKALVFGPFYKSYECGSKF